MRLQQHKHTDLQEPDKYIKENPGGQMNVHPENQIERQSGVQVKENPEIKATVQPKIHVKEQLVVQKAKQPNFLDKRRSDTQVEDLPARSVPPEVQIKSQLRFQVTGKPDVEMVQQSDMKDTEEQGGLFIKYLKDVQPKLSSSGIPSTSY